MSNNFDDRRKAQESQYARDQQLSFKIEARASKLIGLWAAGLLGLSGDAAEAYAKDVIATNIDEPGYDDVKRKIRKDFDDKGVSASDHILDVEIAKYAEQARAQIEAESK